MPGDLMYRVFGDIKAKKSEDLSDEASSLKGLDLKLLDGAIEAANNKRRMVGVWSPTIAAAMWYMKGTIPRFSIREVASHWIEEGLGRIIPSCAEDRGRAEEIIRRQISNKPCDEEIKKKRWWLFWK